MPIDGSDDDCQWIDVNDTSSNRVAIFSIRYSPTGDKIIGGSNNSTVIVGDVETRATQILRTHRMPLTDVNAVSYINDRDPNMIIAGCDDGLLKVYDLRTSFRSRNLSKSVISFIGHFDGITYIDPRNDGYHVLSNSKDQSIKIWDMRKPSNLRNRSTARQHQLSMTTWDYRWDRVPRECKQLLRIIYVIISNFDCFAFPLKSCIILLVHCELICNLFLFSSITVYNPQKALDGDSSIMTYRGHRVSKTLLRAKFSPMEQTGQRFIYTGCATGRIISKNISTFYIYRATTSHMYISIISSQFMTC